MVDFGVKESGVTVHPSRSMTFDLRAGKFVDLRLCPNGCNLAIAHS